MILCCMLFIMVGVIIGVTFLVIGLTSHQLLFLLGSLMGFFFVGLGVSILLVEWNKKAKDKKIIKDGDRVTGKIIDYRNGDGIPVNGMPSLAIVVRCDYLGESREFTVETHQYMESKFPINSYVDIAILGVTAVVVPDTVRFL